MKAKEARAKTEKTHTDKIFGLIEDAVDCGKSYIKIAGGYDYKTYDKLIDAGYSVRTIKEVDWSTLWSMKYVTYIYW